MARKYKDPSQFGAEAYKRSANDVKEERDLGYGRLHDFYKDSDITMVWSNWRGPYEDDMLFKLIIDQRGNGLGKGKKMEVLISKEELLRWLRWV